jgi:hypothetical protein
MNRSTWPLLVAVSLRAPQAALPQDGAQIKPISIVWASKAPVIDGLAADPAWAQIAPVDLKYWAVLRGLERRSPGDLSARFRAAWDNTGLFVLVEVVDDVRLVAPDSERRSAYQFDNVEIYVNADWHNLRTATGEYIKGACTQIRINRGFDTPFSGEGDPEMFALFVTKQRETEEGWTAELHVPWQVVSVKTEELMAQERSIGFEVAVADADDSATRRDALLMWNNQTGDDLMWRNINYFGQVRLSRQRPAN